MRTTTRKISLSLVFAAISFSASAQKIISNGFPGIGVLDGTTYKRTNTINTRNISFVAANANHGFATGQLGKLYFIDLVSETVVDSIAQGGGDMAVANAPDMLLMLSGSYMYRINTANKTIIDSTMVSSTPFRIEQRPHTREAWITDSTQVYVIDYSSGISKSSVTAGITQYDDGEIRFTAGGSTAYKLAQQSKKVYKINAVAKVLTDSANVPNNVTGITVSTDSSKVFVSSSGGKKIYVYNTSDMSLTDSFTTARPPFALYTHPTRAEIWCVNHFDDTVTVYNESNYAEIAAIDLPSSPHNLAFAIGVGTSVRSVEKQQINAMVYPNPVINNLTLSLPMRGSYHISILDNTGRTLKQVHTNEAVVSISVAEWVGGLYHLYIHDAKGNSKYLSWIKN